MDSISAQEILKWIILGVALNAAVLLCIMGGLVALTLHVTRATREITTAVRDVATMTREGLRRMP